MLGGDNGFGKRSLSHAIKHKMSLKKKLEHPHFAGFEKRSRSIMNDMDHKMKEMAHDFEQGIMHTKKEPATT